MNRADPDCGTTFAWVTRAMGPWLGWQGGWAIVVADVLVMPSLASVAGNYTFQLFGNAARRTSRSRSSAIVWIIVMTAICYIGIELSARTQQFLLALEFIDADRCSPSSRWSRSTPATRRTRSSPRSPGSTRSPSRAQRADRRDPARGLHLLGLGLGRERQRGDRGLRARAPGRAAIVSTFMLLGIYLLVTTAAQAYGGLAVAGQQPDRRVRAARQGRARLAARQAADHRRPHLGVGLDPDDDPADGADDPVDGARRRRSRSSSATSTRAS